MNTAMQALLSLSHCAEICGLTSKEMIIGARPRPEHTLLATCYFRSSNADKTTLRVGMVAAIRAALNARQLRSAAELLVALRVMLAGERRHSSAPGSQGRRGLPRCRQPLQKFIETLGDKRAPVGAVVLSLAERRANLASHCASA